MGRQITAARTPRVRSTSETQASSTVEPSAQAHSPQPTPEPSALAAVVLFVVGVVCLVGAVLSFSNARWPAFMLPQLDLVAVPLSWLSEKLGAWVGGALAAVVGVFSILAGLYEVGRNGAA
jgi:hypothetical protein